jgi:hypothetical protein
MSAATANRPTFQSFCADYYEARRALKSVISKPFAWVEAVEVPVGAPASPTRADGVAYTVHSAQSARDVPAFAIEVYEGGALSRYEAERSKIAELAKMNEADRQAAMRAQNARVEVSSATQPRTAMSMHM